jgi:hydrogenase maturation protease
MTVPAPDVVVIGLGNLLRGDDAVGVRVIESLREARDRDPQALPSQTLLVDGGTLGLDLLGTMRDARAVVLVDATRSDGPPGAVSILRGDAVAGATGTRGDADPGAVGELLAIARMLGWLPADVSLVGIEVADIDAGVGMSPAVADALPVALDAVRAELDRIDLILATRMAGGGATTRMAGATA